MNVEFATYKLEELCDFQNGFAFKNGDYVSKSADTKEVFRMGYIERGGGFKEDNTPVFVPENYPKNLERYSLLEGDLTIAMTDMKNSMALLGHTARVPESDRFWLNQRVGRIRVVREDILDPVYLYYYSNSSDYIHYLRSRANSGVQVNLSTSAIKESELTLPPLGYQKKVAKILFDLDKKIELNRQINQTLEQIAQAIFKSWFVDFEPVKAKIEAKQNGQDPERAAMRAISGKTDEELDALSEEQRRQLTTTAAHFPDELEDSELGEIPRGWEMSTIGEEVEVVGGGTPSTKKEEFWEGGEINWTSPKDLSGLQDKILLKTEKKITEAGLAKISSGLLPVDTVLMSSRAPVGYLAQAKIPVAINQGYIAMKCNLRLPPEYVLLWTDSVMDEIKQRASGSTFAEISKKNFKPISIVVPGDQVISKFMDQAKVIYDKIAESVSESASLSEIRDSLLPKLLSGQIELKG
jgi:type I restriction enzyme S subunit